MQSSEHETKAEQTIDAQVESHIYQNTLPSLIQSAEPRETVSECILGIPDIIQEQLIGLGLSDPVNVEITDSWDDTTPDLSVEIVAVADSLSSIAVVEPLHP